MAAEIQRQRPPTKPRVFKPTAVDIEKFPRGQRSNILVRIYEDAAAQPTDLPLIVARGLYPGPTIGITAAVHGNELNGIKIIHGLMRDLDLERFKGCLFCAPIVNVPAYNKRDRFFTDGRDLNGCFPGNAKGQPAEQYARAFLTTFLPACDYLIDIHTASEGRVNTMYVRADLHRDGVRELAELMNPQIILHIRGSDRTLRHAARSRGIPAITVEAGNPSVFQGRMVYEGEQGITNILIHLGLLEGDIVVDRKPVVCRSSKWLRTTSGGLLETQFRLADRVDKGQLLAETRDPFGYPMQRYKAPNGGIVIGMAANPAVIPGSRYCHLGRVGEPDATETPQAEPNRPGGR